MTLRNWFAIIVTLLCSASALAYDFEVDGIYYNITSESEKTVGVCGGINDYHYGLYGRYNIPETIVYKNVTYSVTSIEERAFYKNNRLSYIAFPHSIKTIGDEAFYGCINFGTIILPDGLTNIGKSAFAACKKVTSIKIPKNVTNIGENAFHSCI